MTEVKPRHLFFFIMMFILTWFWNWIAILFMGIVIISICIELYWISFKKHASWKSSAHINCVYYNKHDTMSCLSMAVTGGCNGVCKHYQPSKNKFTEDLK